MAGSNSIVTETDINDSNTEVEAISAATATNINNSKGNTTTATRVTAVKKTRSFPYPMQSVFSSAAFWTIILLLIQAVGPRIEEMARNNKIRMEDIVDVLTIAATCGLNIIDRMNGSALYSPKGFPGPNKPEDE